MQPVTKSELFAGIALLFAGCLLPAYEVDESLGVAGSAGSLPVLPPAPSDCGIHADMVPIPGGYCVDATEVTWGAYMAWHDEQIALPQLDLDQPPECAWNKELLPPVGEMVCVRPNDDTRPVVCVDWCDAYAYCKAVGKRLCGAIGGASVLAQDFANPELSQWTNACTSGGRNVFPYGDDFAPNICHAEGAANAQPVAVKTDRECQSDVYDYQGIFDLSGNVAEWEDSCTAKVGQGDKCRVRGGSFKESYDGASCTGDRVLNREQDVDHVGFRCCWDAPEGPP